MSSNITINEIASNILTELDWFSNELSSNKEVLPSRPDWLEDQYHARQSVLVEKRLMRAEPFICYVQVASGSIFLIRRGYTPDWSPKTANAQYANYLAPIGRLAELPPGNSICVNSVTHTVLAVNRFGIILMNGGYDAINNEIRISNQHDSHLKSLRQYLENFKATGVSTLSQVRFRNIIAEFSLRDQAILDSIQGEILRKPFYSQILLSGPPGSGKTTTLIKRIARSQKKEFLTEEEKNKFSDNDIQSFLKEPNWALFVPNELLKSHIQETFEKQDILNSKERILVWSFERKNIASMLGITKDSGGLFDSGAKKDDYDNAECIELYEKFQNYWPEYTAGILQKSGNATALLDLTVFLGPTTLFSDIECTYKNLFEYPSKNNPFVYVEELYEMRTTLNRLKELVLTSKKKIAIGEAIKKIDSYMNLFLQEIPKAFLHKHGSFLHESEFDVLIRTLLEVIHKLMRIISPNEIKNILPVANKVNQYLIPQIFIDEVSDFSANQIACMVMLSNPKYKSITLAGDIRQRSSYSGIKSWDDCFKILPGLEHHEVEIAYRQSPRLIDIASWIISIEEGGNKYLKSAYQENEVPFPLPLMKIIPERRATYKWVVDRIIDIKNFHGGLTSAIAILSPSEHDATLFSDEFKVYIDEQNLEIKAHWDAGGIKVFDVKDIKGLEFEAVFFMDFEKINALYGPRGLAMRYLYVGLTRAATFFAIICNHEPNIPLSLRNRFSGDETTWKKS